MDIKTLLFFCNKLIQNSEVTYTEDILGYRNSFSLFKKKKVGNLDKCSKVNGDNKFILNREKGPSLYHLEVISDVS